MTREFSAGGLVAQKGRVLLVKVCNLKQQEVWTFPKGHPEDKETSVETALREVEEETGWRCRVLGPLLTTVYKFSRQGRPVSKRVDWFLMEPVKKVGKPDALEVLGVKWVPGDSAAAALTYPTDLELLRKWKNKNRDG